MTHAEFSEAAMLISFSASWHWSIARMRRTRMAAGKSAAFVSLICGGHVFGIAAKWIAWQSSGLWSPLILLYARNLCVTLFDLVLVPHYRRFDGLPA
ncbi:hypothetical protein [Mangrovicoccus ximenensis]|uniref:hypothetical protein n=1 Tax=Mangrovicoccus ximenensis TaxID=1911570 RepID=UPI000D3761FE|nr:hypothetical protein [Mangrovicoccus ximenensis]